MNKIIEHIKDLIVSRCSSNGLMPPLIHHWKALHFQMLAENISDILEKSPDLSDVKKREIGITISGITLKRFFNEIYTSKVSSDRRFVNTLNKLCIFLGYKEYKHFVTENIDLHSTSCKIVEDLPLKNREEEIFFHNLIICYCNSELESLGNLPLINIDNISNYVFDDGPLFDRILKIHQTLAQQKINLNKLHNRSSMQIMNFNTQSMSKLEVIVEAKEYWNLEWLKNNNETAFCYHHINTQVYFIKKNNSLWKIWDNYNPDFVTVQKMITNLT